MSGKEKILSLSTKIRRFYKENCIVILVLFFFTVLAYGYFITNWSISVDSEIGSFVNNTYLFVQDGRIISAIYNYIIHTQVLPFFNDFIAVTLIYLSAILWVFILKRIVLDSNQKSLLIFALIFLVSPMYPFIIRFTISDMFVGFDILIVTISIYYLVLSFNTENLKFLVISVFLLLIILLAYEVFIIYFAVCLLFLTLVLAVTSLNSVSKYSYIRFFLRGLAVLFITLMLYEVVHKVLFFFIAPSNYDYTYLKWGKLGFVEVLINLKAYFVNLIVNQEYSFFLLLTIALSIPYSLYFAFIKKRVDISLLIVLFLLSPFTICFVLGSEMPYRTLLSVTVMLAGMWFLFFSVFNKKIIQNVILVVVVVCTFYNAQYINRLFYSDVMTHEYDKNFANRIYNNVLEKTGSALKDKPLVIVGQHIYTPKPFFLGSKHDTIGASFFEFKGRQRERMFYFMSWLGNDYILPTAAQQKDGIRTSYALKMPSYPDKNYIQETDKFIIVKLSDVQTLYQSATVLNLDDYTELKKSKTRFYIEQYENSNSTFNISGWAYVKNASAKNQQLYLEVVSKVGESDFYPARTILRKDLSKVFDDGYNLQYSGFKVNIDKEIGCDDNIYLLIVKNKKKYVRVKVNKALSCSK